MNYWLLLIPVLTAFTAWSVIRLVIYFLFRPYTSRRFVGIRVQGILPHYQQALADSAARFAVDAFPMTGLDQRINDPANFNNIRPLIEDHIDDFLRNKLKEKIPMVAMFIGEKTIESLKTIFIQEIEELFPQVIGKFGAGLQESFDVELLVKNRLMGVTPASLEELVMSGLRRPLQRVYACATLFGLLIGIIQLLIILLSRG